MYWDSSPSSSSSSSLLLKQITVGPPGANRVSSVDPNHRASLLIGLGFMVSEYRAAMCVVLVSIYNIHTRAVHSGRSLDLYNFCSRTVRSLDRQVRTVRTFLPAKLPHFRSGLWTRKTADSGHSGHARLAVGLEVGLPDPELAVGLRRWLSEQQNSLPPSRALSLSLCLGCTNGTA